ncbi:MAG: hypothetical protein HXY24_11705 [Rubrivivax sp.]|nr:hypothetical protein [Rubrivivax sp.]
MPAADLRRVDAPANQHPADRAAFLLSAVASPYLILPAFILLLVGSVASDIREAVLWAGVGGAGVVGVPLLYTVVGVRQARLTDLHVRLREQRKGPFVAALVGAALSAVGLRLVGAPAPLLLGAVATVVNGLLFALITRRWKISLHPAVLAACGVLAGGTVGPSWYLTLAAVPAVIWARVRRRRHTWAQGWVASLLAAAVTGALVAGWRALDRAPGAG